MNKLPVLVITYNRADSLLRTLEPILDYLPVRLYIASDGPKQSDQDVMAVNEVRKILEHSKWTIPTSQLLHRENLGTGPAVERAIDWFFENEESGVILEDDCVASPDFFKLAAHFLERFEHDSRVWGFTGSNTARARFSGSYGFVGQPLIWGWGTWADRWKQHDRKMTDLREISPNLHQARWPSRAHEIAFSRHLKSIIEHGFPDTWDYQWAWTVMKNEGLWGVASGNLIENIGFGSSSTNKHPQSFAQSFDDGLSEINDPEDISISHDAEWLVLQKIHGVLRPLWLNYPVNAARKVRNYFTSARATHG